MTQSAFSNRQRGFSLVELMVALVVALILLAGILQILLGNRESFGVQQAMAELQENARLTSFVIENVVAHAGYRVNLSTADPYLFPAYSQDSYLDLPIARGAVVASKDGKNDNDAVRLRFQAEGGVHDCQGQEIGSPGNAAIGDVAFYVNDDDNLECLPYSNGTAGTPSPLVSNVDRFKVTYGLDTNGDNAVDTYVRELSSSNATSVRSLRLQLLLRTEQNVRLAGGDTQTYDFADGTHLDVAANDLRARQLVDQTVALRNLLP